MREKDVITIPVVYSYIKETDSYYLSLDHTSKHPFLKSKWMITAHGKTKEDAIADFWASYLIIHAHFDAYRILSYRWRPFTYMWRGITHFWFCIFGIKIVVNILKGMRCGTYILGTNLNIQVVNYWKMNAHSFRQTPQNITKLESNQIFVFGSNLAGRHGKGAAKTAKKWGAIPGRYIGLQGKTYGIPTKDFELRTLSTSQIKEYVDEFIQFAKENKEKEFLVTEIGCGLAGLSPAEIAPLFKDAVEVQNIHLPKRFWKVLNQTYKN